MLRKLGDPFFIPGTPGCAAVPGSRKCAPPPPGGGGGDASGDSSGIHCTATTCYTTITQPIFDANGANCRTVTETFPYPCCS